MAAATCSSGLIFKSRESIGNGVSLFQYNGLKAAGAKQVAVNGVKTHGPISTSGMISVFGCNCVCVLVMCDLHLP